MDNIEEKDNLVQTLLNIAELDTIDVAYETIAKALNDDTFISDDELCSVLYSNYSLPEVGTNMTTFERAAIALLNEYGEDDSSFSNMVLQRMWRCSEIDDPLFYEKPVVVAESVAPPPQMRRVRLL